MSHQTGIRANDELKRFFALCKNGSTRLIKIGIKNGKDDGVVCDDKNDEQLVLASHKPVRFSFQQDYDSLVPNCLEDYVPCFLIIRLDSLGHSGYDWLFISYIPDCASVRQKMVYAATQSTLKKEFGAGNIKEEFHASCKQDVSFDAYMSYKRSKETPGPMTEVEAELGVLKISERLTHTGGLVASQALAGLAFPIDRMAFDKLVLLRDGLLNYVQLSVDVRNEAIKLERSETILGRQLKNQIPKNHPRYHFYAFKHQYEGSAYNSFVFIYSMPHQGCSIKEKMLYSSCKNPFLETVRDVVGLSIDKKIEVDCSEEVTEDLLLDELHPKVHHQIQFARPQGPASRGQRRITRPVQ